MEKKNQINEIDFDEIYKNEMSGGTVLRHSDVDINADDYPQVYEIAIDKANEGSIVKILPEIQANDPRRTILFPGAKENKCPDLNVDGEYVEIKTPTLPLKHSKLGTCIRNSRAQADWVILRLTAK